MASEASYKEVARVRDIIERSYRHAREEEEVDSEALQLNPWEIIIVTSGSGEYVGIVTPADACRAGRGAKYGSIARRDYPLIDPDTSILKALEIMAITNTTTLPVVESGRVAGVVTLFGIYRWLSEALEVEELYTAG